MPSPWRQNRPSLPFSPSGTAAWLLAQGQAALQPSLFSPRSRRSISVAFASLSVHAAAKQLSSPFQTSVSLQPPLLRELMKLPLHSPLLRSLTSSACASAPVKICNSIAEEGLILERRIVQGRNLNADNWQRVGRSTRASVAAVPWLVGGSPRSLRQLARRVREEEEEEEVEEKITQSPQSSFPEHAWRRKLEHLLNSTSETELVLREKDHRKHANNLQALSRAMGLFCFEYSKAVVISKDPLPHYRPDLDLRRPQRQLALPETVRREVENVVGSFRALRVNKGANSAASPTSVMDEPTETEGFSTEKREKEVAMENLFSRRRSERLLAKQTTWRESADGKWMLELRRNLPAHRERDYLLEAIANNQVLVVSGETGCGKTTQLPQFILESEIEAGRGGDCSIICTQPRRISAISVAERVAAERGEDIGDSVGYQVRLEGKKSRNTRLLFCTTGILLRRLSMDPLLKGVSHVVVDEIHERGMNEDFLLIVLKDLLLRRPNLRLVLMSATLNAELFSKYFENAPTAHIPGFTHPVEAYFLEDVLEMTGHILTPYNQIDDYGVDKQWKRARQIQAMSRRKRNTLTALAEDALDGVRYSDYSRATQVSLANWIGDNAGFNLIEAVLTHIVSKEQPGAVLVFMTGWEDIHGLLEKLRGHHFLGDSSHVLLLACHGSMSSAEQKLIFNPAPPGVRKIVLATNMAETSITINDCVFVVDVGKAKETSYDALNNTPCLLPSWISQASARQRRGRAGRVQPGVCYHLYPKAVHDALPEYTIPELLRTPLHSLCLQIKSLHLGSIADFLGKALQPPEPLAVQNAIELLEDVGALDKNENLTALGRHLTQLPLDPRVGKMLCMAAVLKCLDPILTVAAGLAERDPWLIPADKKEIADHKRQSFGGESCSDHIALVRVYEGWEKAVGEGRAAEQDFCMMNFVSRQTLQAMRGLRRAFLKTLGELGLVDPNGAGLQEASRHSEDGELVRAVILAGLFPAVASAVKKNRSTTFKTKEDGSVNLHPNSVTSKNPRFPYPWLAFNEKVKTSSVFIRDATGVTDTALLLFGGQLYKGEEPGYLHMHGGHFEFFMPPDSARTVMLVRGELEALIQRKLEDPSVDIHEEGKPVIGAVLTLLHSDKQQGSFVYGRVPKVKKDAKQKEISSTRKEIAAQEEASEDKKNSLCNYCKKYKLGKPRFKVEELGPAHEPQFRAMVSIGGKFPQKFYGEMSLTKRMAEKSAAAVAWDRMKGAKVPGQVSVESGEREEREEREGGMEGEDREEQREGMGRRSKKAGRQSMAGKREPVKGRTVIMKEGMVRGFRKGERGAAVQDAERSGEEEEKRGVSPPKTRQRQGRREKLRGGKGGEEEEEEREWEERAVRRSTPSWGDEVERSHSGPLQKERNKGTTSSSSGSGRDRWNGRSSEWEGRFVTPAARGGEVYREQEGRERGWARQSSRAYHRSIGERPERDRTEELFWKREEAQFGDKR